MSREIKFRAWSKINKIMLKPKDLSGWTLEMINADTFISMQYTGLKDKNGIEQFESDIVKRNGIIGEIRWDNLEARFRICCDNAKPIPCNYPVGSDWEVIGNIYENPDLLDERKTQI